jgi:hypothetical protein
MNEASEKYEDIMQYELDALKEIREKCFEHADGKTPRSGLVRGTALGLTLGIVSSLFALFLYPVLEAFLHGEYGLNFSGNLIICSVSLIIIVLVAIFLRWQLMRAEKDLKLSTKSLEVIEYAIKRRQRTLEKKKAAHPPHT